MRINLVMLAVMVSVAARGAPALAGDLSAGLTDTTIRLGQTMPYSGPASSFAPLGLTEAAYYRMVNEAGGVNGRRIEFISLDDGYQPNRAVEQTRRLVEQDGVLAIVGSLGTVTNAAVQRYLNDRHVPQLFITTGAGRFADPEHFPWTIAFALHHAAEARVHAKRILATRPDARIAILYQNDDFGREYAAAFRQALGDRAAAMIVKEESYEPRDPTVDQQVLALRDAGADVLLDIAIPRFAAQAIRRAWDLGWKPLHILSQPAVSVVGTLRPAGLDRSVGVISADFTKDPADPSWVEDPEVIAYLAFMRHYRPDADAYDRNNVGGYINAAAVVALLRLCGEGISRENVMHQATHLTGLRVPMMLPGVTMNTTPSNYAGIRQMRLQRFDGERWRPLGDIVTD